MSIAKKKVYKAILENPYGRLIWPEIEESDEKLILESLQVLLKTGKKNGSIIMGFNEINEILEQCVHSNKKPIAMIISRSDVNSSLVTGHFPLLSAVTGVKLVALPSGSAQQISSTAQVSTNDASFILIKKGLSGAQALYDILDRIPDVEIPWIKKHKTVIKSVQTTMNVRSKASRENSWN